MKRLFVLTTVLVTVSAALTGCWNTASEPEPEPQPLPVEKTTDSLPKQQADSAAAVAPDTITE